MALPAARSCPWRALATHRYATGAVPGGLGRPRTASVGAAHGYVDRGDRTDPDHQELWTVSAVGPSTSLRPGRPRPARRVTADAVAFGVVPSRAACVR